MDEKTLERYLKIRALAERGEKGERATAQKLVAQFEKQHPTIRQDADAFLRAQEAAAGDPDGSHGIRSRWREMRTGNWENLFGYAWTIYETVVDVAETMTDAYRGFELANEGVEERTTQRDHVLYYKFKIPFSVVKQARELNAPQREAFRQVLHDKLDTFLDLLLGH